MGVAETYEHSKTIEKPTVCPACGAPVQEVGAFLYCTGEHCAPQVISMLDHFASKDAMDIEGFSEKTAEQFYNEIELRSVVDLMNLKAEDMFGLEGFGDKKISNLLASIDKSKHTTADRFLYALGIDGIGKKTAKDLIKRFRTLKSLQDATFEELSQVDGIGGILANNIVEYFADENNKKIISDLIQSGVVIEEIQEVDGVFKGIKFVLTGSLPTLKRGEATAIIEQNGGEVASSVSKAVNIVLAGEDAGSKLEKAKKLGIKIISENEFRAMLE
jgi:DNA ligase (NAD+)